MSRGAGQAAEAPFRCMACQRTPLSFNSVQSKVSPDHRSNNMCCTVMRRLMQSA